VEIIAGDGFRDEARETGARLQATLDAALDAVITMDHLDRGRGAPGEALHRQGQAVTGEHGRVGGSGLAGLRDRVVALGGTFELTSEAGVGTEVRARLRSGAEADARGA
jgi:signal transduction histidine kinase